MKTQKPWGYFERFSENQTSTVKIITVLPKKRTSLQYHEHRSEKWFVISGNGYVWNPEKNPVQPGDEIEIPKNTIHRIEANTELKILEISFGDFDENDIKRIEDDFGRV